MRTTTPVLVVLAIGVAGLMIGGSGFTDVWGAKPPQVDSASSQVNASSANVSPNSGPVSGPVSTGDSSIVGLIVNGLGSLVDIAGAVAVLPLTLMNLGFPAWFAVPIGIIGELIVGIGLVEFATNRDWT